METDIILKLQQILSAPWARMFVVASARWLIYAFIPIVFLSRAGKHMKLLAYEAAWTALVAWSLTSVIAALIDRVRPYLAVKGVMALVPPNIQSGSFPSSHTAIAFGIAMMLMNVNPKFGVIALVMATLVALGRVASGMHYPSDVVGGAAVGVLAFLIVRAVAAGLERI